MHRAPRIVRSIDSLGVTLGSRAPPPFLCYACRHHTPSFSTSALRREKKDGSLPWTEGFRRRIWGTDDPPGPKDPYSRPGAGGNRPGVDTETVPQVETREAGQRRAPQLVEIDPDYEPATTWDGLETIDGIDHTAPEIWDASHPFKAFLPADILGDPDEVTVAVHRAVVEVFALRKVGVHMHEFFNEAPGADQTQSVQVAALNTGASLHFPEGTTLEDFVKSLAPSDTEAQKEDESPLSPKELIAFWDPSWLQVSLANSPKIKFAVIKRSLQLTGIRLPDYAIQSITTIQSLLAHLVTPPKPLKLADALADKEDLINLSNVKVHRKRLTVVEKEQDLGRWKLIQKELSDRGLAREQNREI